MKKFTINKYLAYVIGIIFFFFLWWIISLIIDERVMIFPDPYSTFVEMIKILQTSYVYKCFANSLSRLLIGFGYVHFPCWLLGTGMKYGMNLHAEVETVW